MRSFVTACESYTQIVMIQLQKKKKKEKKSF